MRKRRRFDSSCPNQSYLISFGDTMTALLAFFIVINTIAKDQTGAKLYSGTGSFSKSLHSFGMSVNKATGKSIQREYANPLYVVNDDHPRIEQAVRAGQGPDSNSNSLRVIERQKDQLRRFLIEMEQWGSANPMPKTKGAAVFDFFEPIQTESPLVSDSVAELFRLSTQALSTGQTELEIVVWSRTPGTVDWKESVHQAESIRRDLIQRTALDKRHSRFVRCQGKPWFYADQRRPRFSIVIRKIGS